MFLCPKCKNKMRLPACTCGFTVRQQNMIWQLSDMPDMVTDGDGDKYIGYEHIGGNYSGTLKYLIGEADALFAGEVSEITGSGVLLDLACGDGCLTVPCAANGTEIIAGDISNNMLSVLQQKAKYNAVSLEKVTLCRMNALDIPLSEGSVCAAVANSMLHLISNPQKVIAGIYRVLAKGGSFICREDRPDKSRYSEFDNARYNQLANALDSGYWKRLKPYGVTPVRYSWEFNREEYCDNLFSQKREKVIKRGKLYETALKDGFLPRYCSRGFSAQANVPQKLHDDVIAEVLAELRDGFGDDFADVCFRGVEDDLVITVYTK